MPHNTAPLRQTLSRDLTASVVLFIVALPLCMGVALSSQAPPFSGLLAGIIGGLLVGILSGSHKSVSGPAAGLIAITAAQIGVLGSFEAFLLALTVAGLLQVILGICRVGGIAAFFPSCVVKGLLAAIGLILILKQFPHILGHDSDPMGNKSFFQADHENTFSELKAALLDIQPGAALVGLLSIGLMLMWDRIKVLKKLPVPPALFVVLLGVGLNLIFRQTGSTWTIEATHLVQVPVAQDLAGFLSFLKYPDFSQLYNPAIYSAAVTIALVASLETLLNIEAVDKIDPEQRRTPPNRELIAQGVGNAAAGLIGGLPMTSVIVRSSVNINGGAKTKVSVIVQGVLLLLCVMLMPRWLNEIPLSSVAAILFVVGLRLFSPKLIQQMWGEGKNQFLPFIITIAAIVFSDLLTGVLIGLGTSVAFILNGNLRRPLRRVVESHVGGEVLRIELASQVNYLSRASLEKTLHEVPRGGHVLLDARSTDYIDPDVLDLIDDFRKATAAAHGVQLSMVGFKEKYQLEDHILYADYSSREVQSSLTPERVLRIFQEGNERFLSGRRLTRDLGRQVGATSLGQFPMAVVLNCIDSRTPAELIFDLGLGDVFSVRIAGNIAQDKVLGSIEYSCAVAGARLILVMGHTSCGAVNAAVDLICSHKTAAEATGCVNLDSIVTEIQKAVDMSTCKQPGEWLPGEKAAYANEVSRRNIVRTMRKIRERSSTLDGLVREGKVAIVGALYDIQTGRVSYFQTQNSSKDPLPIAIAAVL